MSRASTLAKAVGPNGDISVSGNTTIGDASTDTVTFNAATASIPNNLNFTNGNFGVGVTPTSRITVGRVDSTNEGGQIDFCRASDNSNHYAIDVYGGSTTPSLRFIDNAASTTRLTLDSSGNFGIGASPPTNKLDVNGGTRIRDGYGLYLGAGAEQYISASGSSGSVALTFNAWNGSSYVERARITSGGIVGIATPTPWAGSTLDVNGNSNFRSNMYMGNSANSQALST